MNAAIVNRTLRGVTLFIAPWFFLSPGAWGQDTGGTLTINGERIEMPFAYAELEPDGFIPDSQALALVLANRELTPDEYYSYGEEDTHIIRLSVGPDQLLRSFTLIDKKLASGSVSGFGFATLEFNTFEPPELAGLLYTADTFEGSQDRLDVDIRFRVTLDEDWNLAEALEKQVAYRSASAGRSTGDVETEQLLFEAVESNDLEAVRNMVAGGAGIDVQFGGKSLLGYAAENGLGEMVGLLLESGADASQFNGYSPMGLAIESGSIETVERFVGSGRDLSGQEMTLETLGMLAVKTANPAMVELLLGHVDFNAADTLGSTPVLAATQEGGEAMQAIVVLLAEAGVDLSPQGGYETPLYHAVVHDKPAMVRTLLTAGADANLKTGGGEYPLFAALEKPEIAGLLLAAGADPNFKTDWGETPLMAAVGMGVAKTVELLLQHDADPTVENNQGYSALDMAINGGRDEIAALFEKTAPDQPAAVSGEPAADGAGQIREPGAQTDLPKIQSHADVPMPGTAVSYASTANVRDALAFYDQYFTGAGWRIVGNFSDYSSYATAQYENDVGGASLSIVANNAVSPPETIINVTMHGTTKPTGFPRYPGTEVVYEDIGTAIYLSNDSIDDVAAGTRSVFTAAGWQASNVASEPKFVHLRFVQSSTTLNAVITEAPAQDNKTSIQYSISSE